MGTYQETLKMETENPIIGYMCETDWRYELGQAEGCCKVYPSVEDCLEKSKCVGVCCGMVEVEIKLLRIIMVAP